MYEHAEKMIDTKAVEAFMKSQGFERMGDYCESGGCSAPLSGGIMQFYNPKTKIGVQFCLGDLNDDLMFDESFQLEVKEKWE